MKDSHRKLPNPVLQPPRDTDFPELESVHLPCRPVQSSRPQPQRRALGPALSPSSCVSCPVPLGNGFLSVCPAEMVVTGPVWAYGQPALFFQFLRHLPPRPLPPVQSKGFYFALCHCGQLILSWPCFQIAVSGQRPLGLPPPSPSSQPATCMCSLGFCSITLGAEEALGGSSSGPSEAVPAAPPGPPPVPLTPSATCGSTPAWPCCLCKCWTGRQPHTNPQLSTELQSRSLEFPPDNLHFWGLSVLSPAS